MSRHWASQQFRDALAKNPAFIKAIAAQQAKNAATVKQPKESAAAKAAKQAAKNTQKAKDAAAARTKRAAQDKARQDATAARQAAAAKAPAPTNNVGYSGSRFGLGATTIADYAAKQAAKDLRLAAFIKDAKEINKAHQEALGQERNSDFTVVRGGFQAQSHEMNAGYTARSAITASLNEHGVTLKDLTTVNPGKNTNLSVDLGVGNFIYPSAHRGQGVNAASGFFSRSNDIDDIGLPSLQENVDYDKFRDTLAAPLTTLAMIAATVVGAGPLVKAAIATIGSKAQGASVTDSLVAGIKVGATAYASAAVSDYIESGALGTSAKGTGELGKPLGKIGGVVNELEPLFNADDTSPQGPHAEEPEKAGPAPAPEPLEPPDPAVGSNDPVGVLAGLPSDHPIFGTQAFKDALAKNPAFIEAIKRQQVEDAVAQSDQYDAEVQGRLEAAQADGRVGQDDNPAELSQSGGGTDLSILGDIFNTQTQQEPGAGANNNVILGSDVVGVIGGGEQVSDSGRGETMGNDGVAQAEQSNGGGNMSNDNGGLSGSDILENAARGAFDAVFGNNTADERGGSNATAASQSGDSSATAEGGNATGGQGGAGGNVTFTVNTPTATGPGTIGKITAAIGDVISKVVDSVTDGITSAIDSVANIDAADIGALIDQYIAKKDADKAIDATEFNPFDVAVHGTGKAIFGDNEASVDIEAKTGELINRVRESALQDLKNPDTRGVINKSLMFGNDNLREVQQDALDTQSYNPSTEQFAENQQGLLGGQNDLFNSIGGINAFKQAGAERLGAANLFGTSFNKGNELFNTDYQSVADERLGLLRQRAQPFEDRAFNTLQSNLYGTGRFGTTGGGIQTEAFARGLGQADLERQLVSQTFGDQLRQQDRQVGASLFGTAGAALNSGSNALQVGLQGTSSLGNLQNLINQNSSGINQGLLRGQQGGVQKENARGTQRLKTVQDIFGFGQDARAGQSDQVSSGVTNINNLTADQRALLALGGNIGGQQAAAGANAAQYIGDRYKGAGETFAGIFG